MRALQPRTSPHPAMARLAPSRTRLGAIRAVWPGWDPDRLDRDHDNPCGDHVQLGRGRTGEIEDSTASVRPAIGDLNQH
jgi:hypothetical protein